MMTMLHIVIIVIVSLFYIRTVDLFVKDVCYGSVLLMKKSFFSSLTRPPFI